ncbi:MAG: hypothetical protein AAGJ34_05765 [Pseudomonadota bacterium]
MIRVLCVLSIVAIWVSPVFAQGFGGGLTKGVGAADLRVGFEDAPDKLIYRINTRTLPAPMQVHFNVTERSNGFTLNGNGIFEADEDMNAVLFPLLQNQMGDRVQLREGIIHFKLISRLDESRRAKEVAMFGISKWFQPNDCFTVLGECMSTQESALGLGRRVLVNTSEVNGVWRARATVIGSDAFAYSASYTVDAAGFLIDENRTEMIDGVKVRTTVRRLVPKPER